MNRVGFMGQLEGLLADIPAAEKEEALQYYNDYFDDAGEENEENVIRSLGSPSKVAENIKAELRGEKISAEAKPGDHAVMKYDSAGEAARPQTAELIREEPRNREELFAGGAEKNTVWRETYAKGEIISRPASGGGGGGGGQMPTWLIVLIVVGCCISWPFVLSILAGVIATVIGLLVSWFSLIGACGAVSIAMFVSAIVLVVIGGMCASASPLVCMTLIGIAMLCASIGLLTLMLTVWLAGKVTPMIFRGIKRMFGWLFGIFRKKRTVTV